MEGDRKYGIETLSTRMGTRAVAFLGELPILCSTLFSIFASETLGGQLNV